MDIAELLKPSDRAPRAPAPRSDHLRPVHLRPDLCMQLRRIDPATGPRSSDQVPAAAIPITPAARGPAKARAFTLAHPISASPLSRRRSVPYPRS